MKNSLIFAFLLCCTSLFSHPHSFIVNQYKFYVSNSGLDKIGIVWHLDEMFSESVMFDIDKNKNRKIDEDERERVYSDAFMNTKNYNYFLDLKIGNKTVKIDSVSNFYASYEENVLIYEFEVSMPQAYKTLNLPIRIFSYDPTYYVLIEPDPKTGVQIIKPKKQEIVFEMIKKNYDFKNYGKLPVSGVELYVFPEN